MRSAAFPFQVFAVVVLLLGSGLSFVGCGDNAESATIAGCWSFYVDECTTGFYIVVEDDPIDNIDEFRVTFTEVDLISDGEAFNFFSGSRRVDLLSYQSRGFVLAHRTDIPGVAFDSVRFRVEDLQIVPTPAGGQPTLPDDGFIEIDLGSVVRPESDVLKGLTIDFDVSQSLIEVPGGLEVEPFVVTQIEQGPVNITGLRVLVLEDPVVGRPFAVMSDNGVGEQDLYTDLAIDVNEGDWIEIEGSLHPDGSLEATAWVAVTSGIPGLAPVVSGE